mmetsp:Transcript_21956/g.43162  ORF Transcript_21956/g.43162 Transcript_21956/m.43162 type:complete len:472 (-) Transcript_21956:71-1486(-)|eukprot:CAMPEP_0171488178 /NCGR_PEP_ID=MMETSP0958-20121227/2067_1 /TAXON_ID=87120 /ORGANISM="Aurantiochytrium limacinum, Strain ATCCMYA-1381" /LENGTH=471 /DNA_ID=CAMNT_0012021271 /DNA_START=184 /DNA_END=1599 /DNA_ORIENTATION=-
MTSYFEDKDAKWFAGAGAGVACALILGRAALKKAKRIHDMEIDVNTLKPGFESVRDVFEANYREGREEGSQLAVYVNGELVVDLNGGRNKERKLAADDLTVIFSCTKVVESLAIAMLEDRGLIDYEAPISKYWPSLGLHASVTDLMRHEGGVPVFQNPQTKAEGLKTFSDPDLTQKYLENNKPEWIPEKPTKRRFYHAVTRGMYASEIVRRTDGRTIKEFIAEEIVNKDPLIKDFTVGCPPEKQDKVAHHSLTQPRWWIVLRYFAYSLLPRWFLSLFYAPLDQMMQADIKIADSLQKKGSIYVRALTLFSDLPASILNICNDRDVRALPLSSVTGISNARSVARIFSNLVMGEYLSEKGLKAALANDVKLHPLHVDGYMHRAITMSNCGWGLDRYKRFEFDRMLGLTKEIFEAPGWVGWGGVGGSVLVFNPELKASFSFNVNGLDSQNFKARGVRLLHEVNKILTSSKSKN